MERQPLRRNGPFVRYWTASTISLVGSQFTFLALPLTAVGVLHARPAQIALLATAATAPNLLGLLAGEHAGRLRRRPTLIVCDLGRAGLLATVPAAWALGSLHLSQLYVVAVATGGLSLVFELASQAYVPALVDRSQLVPANAAFEVARGGAQSAGPAAAGALIGAVAAPLGILVDAASYVASAALLATVSIPERRVPSRPRATRATLRAVLGHAQLRALLAAHGLANLAIGLVWSVAVVYAVRTLGLGSFAIGTALALGQVGAVAGALAGRGVAGRIGVGRALFGAFLLFGPAALLIAGAPRPLALPFLAAGWMLDGVARSLYGVLAAAVRQAAIPLEAQARVAGVTMTVGLGAFPLGTLLGGALAGPLGLRATMIAGAGASFLPCLPVLASPLVRLRRLDELDAVVFADGSTSVRARPR